MDCAEEICVCEHCDSKVCYGKLLEEACIIVAGGGTLGSFRGEVSGGEERFGRRGGAAGIIAERFDERRGPRRKVSES